MTASDFATGSGVETVVTAEIYGNPAPSFFAQTLASTVGGAYSGNQYLTFTLTPNAGYALNLSSVSFDIAAGVTSGTADQVSQAYIYTNLDNGLVPVGAGFAEYTAVADGSQPSPYSHFTNDLGAIPLYQDVTGPIHFTVYFFGTNSNGLVSLDNIEIDGTATATPTSVPEPASAVLMLLGCVPVLFASWRVIKRA